MRPLRIVAACGNGAPRTFDLNSAEQIPDSKNQIAHQQDNEAAMNMRNRDVSIVNEYRDQGYNDRNNERDNSWC